MYIHPDITDISTSHDILRQGYIRLTCSLPPFAFHVFIIPQSVFKRKVQEMYKKNVQICRMFTVQNLYK